MSQSIQCLICKHYEGARRCAAFLNKPIPEDILTGKFDHEKQLHPEQRTQIKFEEDYPGIKKDFGVEKK